MADAWRRDRELAEPDAESQECDDRDPVDEVGARPIVQRIAERRAQTLNGLLVKAKAIDWTGREIPIEDHERTTDVGLAFSIGNDLIAMLQPGF